METATADSNLVAAADTESRQEFRQLDEDVQDLKKEVLDLNRDLFLLEEELLFPANSQVAFFVSLDVGEYFDLDSVSLRIDGREVANYLYTEREVEALHRGGVQRLPLDQVLYLRAESKYVSAHHREGELLLEESLKSLESRFGDWFLRIHRNALVARHALAGLERTAGGVMRVRFKDCTERLEVSRRHLPSVRRWLKDVE